MNFIRAIWLRFTWDAHERRNIARAFNDRYTYRHKYVEDAPELFYKEGGIYSASSGYAWMCPECNKIHHPYAYDPLVGILYPACCKTHKGHRLHDGIKTS